MSGLGLGIPWLHFNHVDIIVIIYIGTLIIKVFFFFYETNNKVVVKDISYIISQTLLNNINPPNFIF